MTATLIVGAGVLIAGPAGAATTATESSDLTPVFECSAPNSDGGYTAFFGYSSARNSSVDIPVGAKNQFSAQPKDRGQPTTFTSGRHVAVFGAPFEAGDKLTWHLGTATATADTTTLCSTPAELSESSTWMALPAASLGSVAVWGLIQRRRRNNGGSPTPPTALAA